ncbi:MAG: phenylalanine--tRNA ligase subunit alpha, partial [Clostridia bacterium]|nr:phenylalanine--tRNA ligase subunit alpha [Clostridia bacterium]
MMEEKIREIRQEIEAGIDSFESSKALYEFRKIFLDNKEGKIAQLMKGMKDVPKEERPAFGKVVNEIKEWAISRFEETDKKMKRIELQKRNAAEAV